MGLVTQKNAVNAVLEFVEETIEDISDTLEKLKDIQNYLETGKELDQTQRVFLTQLILLSKR